MRGSITLGSGEALPLEEHGHFFHQLLLCQKIRYFIKCISSNWVSKENILNDEDGPLANGCTEKAEDVRSCFDSVFSTVDKPWASQSSQLEEHSYSNSDFPFVDARILSGQLQELNVLKSTEPWWDSS